MGWFDKKFRKGDVVGTDWVAEQVMERYDNDERERKLTKLMRTKRILLDMKPSEGTFMGVPLEEFTSLELLKIIKEKADWDENMGR